MQRSLERIKLRVDYACGLSGVRTVDGNAGGGDGGSGLILGGENVAGAPLDLGAEGNEGLDEDGGLGGHVEASSNAGTAEWLGSGVLGTDGHQSWHLILSQIDLLAAGSGEVDVSCR